jgi:hypothetical protein
VEFVLVAGVVDHGVGGGVLRGDEALGGDHGDVPLLLLALPGQRPRRRLDGGEQAVVVDVGQHASLACSGVHPCRPPPGKKRERERGEGKGERKKRGVRSEDEEEREGRGRLACGAHMSPTIFY